MNEMTSRERILTALRLEQPDRVPFMDWVSPRIQEAIMGKKDFTTAEFARKINLDAICYDFFPPLFAKFQESEGLDIVVDGLIKEEKDLKLMDALPDPDDESIYEPVKRFIDENYKSDLAICGRIRLGLSCTYESMGMMTFSYALYDNPKLIETVLDRYAEWCIKVADRLAALGTDYFWSCDDIAFKTGLMFSPQVFREIFMPRMKKVAGTYKLPWVYHSDGNVMDVMEDLISLKPNAIHPLEPGAMDIAEVKKQYGQRVCLIGNIDLKHTLTRGTVEEVDAEVKQRISEVGPGGGYILSSANSLPHYVKPENVVAMGEAVRKYGAYPLQV